MPTTDEGDASLGRPKLSPRKKLRPGAVSLLPEQWEELDAIVETFNKRNPKDKVTRNDLMRQFLAWACREFQEELSNTEEKPRRPGPLAK